MIRNLALSLLTVTTFATSAHAARLRGQFTTLLAGRQDARVGDVVSVIPLYELVSLDVTELSLPGVDRARLVLSGWGRLQLGEDGGLDPNESGFTPTTGDVALFYMEAQTGPVSLRLGRQHLSQGVGRMHLVDGLNLDVSLPLGTGAQAFYGLSVQPELHVVTDRWIGGGRLYKRLPGTGEVGLGYALRTHNGELYGQDFGADAFYLAGPTSWQALAVLSPGGEELEALRLKEARLAGSYTGLRDWLVTIEAERVAPDLFMSRQSIFTVFANSNHDAVGTEIGWDPSPYYRLEAEAHLIRRDGEHQGYDAALKATTFRDPARKSRVGAELKMLDERDDGYIRARVLTALQILDNVRVAADLFAFKFTSDVNGFGRSVLGQASAVYDITESMRLVASVAGGETPYAEARVEGMLRFAYGYNVDFGREVSP